MPGTPATPNEKSTVISELERLGIKYTEVAQYDLDRLSPERRIQVRDADNYARKEDVDRYAVQMELSTFPAIVVTSDDWIVDGNTRIGAALKRKQHRFPAYVLDRRAVGDTESHSHELFVLATSLNQHNGRSLTKAELRTNMPHYVALGLTVQQIGRDTGFKPSVVNGIKKELEAREKLQRVGLRGNGELKGTSLRALGGPLVLQLNDDPYHNLAVLAVDAGLNAKEIFEAAKQVKETGSDTAGMVRIQQLRAENEGRIRQRTLTGTGKPPIARQLRQHLGFVVKLATQPEQLVERNAEVAPQHAEVLAQAITVLQDALTQQRALVTAQ